MSKYLDNTGLSRLITKVKSLITPPPEFVTFTKTDNPGVNASVYGTYTLTASFDVWGDTHKLRSIVFRILKPNYSETTNISFSFSQCPYLDEIRSALANPMKVTLTAGVKTMDNTLIPVIWVFDVSINETGNISFTRNNDMNLGTAPSSTEKYYINTPIVLYSA